MKKLILFLVGFSMLVVMVTNAYAETLGNVLSSKQNIEMVQKVSSQSNINLNKVKKEFRQDRLSTKIEKEIYKYGSEKIEEQDTFKKLVKEEKVQNVTHNTAI